MAELHLAYEQTARLRGLLEQWDAQIAAEPPVARHRWTNIALWPSARSATVAGSTGIEGNPLTALQVGEVLAGAPVPARAADIREVMNYNSALDLANRAALRSDFEWSQELLRRLNATVMHDLEDDERGEYRQEAVTVGGAYSPPEHQRIPSLMAQLVDWFQTADCPHPVVWAGLTHLNVVAIHPWLDGNGRTARVAGSLMLMRCGIGSPDLLNVESAIRADRSRYFNVLQHTHGPRYQAEEHSATEWLEYFAEICVGQLDLQNRLTDAVQSDFGLLASEVSTAGMPMECNPILLAASLSAIRVPSLARQLGLSESRTRAMVALMTERGWLRAIGERRGRHYAPGPRLLELPLRAPQLLERFRGSVRGVELSRTP